MLNKFYDDAVKMNRDETIDNAKSVVSIVEKIMKHVESKDKRFGKKVLKVGSYYSYSKVSAADEFDMCVVLNTSPTVFHSDSNEQRFMNMMIRKKVVVPNSSPLSNPPP